MAVHKSAARLRAADGTVIGEGRAYLHLPRGSAEPQPAGGTLSLDWWDQAESAPAPAELALVDGPTLPLSVSSDRLSACLQGGRILRYTTTWPGA